MGPIERVNARSQYLLFAFCLAVLGVGVGLFMMLGGMFFHYWPAVGAGLVAVFGDAVIGLGIVAFCQKRKLPRPVTGRQGPR